MQWLPMSSLLQINNLNVTFSTQTGDGAAVRDVSFVIPESGTMGLVGESGSGKSATALAILRLLPPQARGSGGIGFGGQSPLRLAGEEMRRPGRAALHPTCSGPMDRGPSAEPRGHH